MDKILPIVGTVFSLLALVVSVIVLLQVNAINGTLKAQQEEPEIVDPDTIPLGELDTYTLPEDFLFTFTDDETNTTTNVNLTIGFSLWNDEAHAEEALRVKGILETKDSIIRDKISIRIREKTATSFTTNEGEHLLREELLQLVRELIQTDVIVDISFSMIVSER